jgi:hypothetical protein
MFAWIASNQRIDIVVITTVDNSYYNIYVNILHSLRRDVQSLCGAALQDTGHIIFQKPADYKKKGKIGL